MDLDKNKEQFLLNEYQNMSILASLSTRDANNPIYKKGLTDEENKNVFKKYLKNKLLEYSQQYKRGVDENSHNKNIEKLTNEITTEHKEILHKGKFRIGITQKLLNLYLKYLWVADKIPAPPHCPFDSVVINKLKIHDIKWASLDDIEKYKLLVEKARRLAGNKTLSEWELELWNQR